MTELIKPKKYPSNSYYNLVEVFHYLEKLHNKDFRDYAGRYANGTVNESVPYQDFWIWLVDIGTIPGNDTWGYMPDYDSIMENDQLADWLKEILTYFVDFLGDDYYEKMSISW